MTPHQRLAVHRLLISYPENDFHHGDCVGADEQAHTLARMENSLIWIHPPENPLKRAYCQGSRTAVPKPYLTRNRDIVDACDVMIAAPGEPEEQLRSGTWATIRYARKVGKPVFIVLPNGRVIAP